MADLVLELTPTDGSAAISGEAQYDGWVGKIAIKEMTLSATQEVDVGKNQTRTLHTVKFENVAISRNFDGSSWAILDGMIQSKTYTAKVHILKAAGGEASFVEFCTYTFEKSIITKCDTSFNDGEPTDNIELNFTKMIVSYKPQLPTGKLGGNVGTNFNVQLGKKES